MNVLRAKKEIYLLYFKSNFIVIRKNDTKMNHNKINEYTVYASLTRKP